MKVKLLSRVRLLATPWTAAHQAPLSMGFARQEYWSGVPLHVVLSTRKSYPSYFVELISILYIGIIKNTNLFPCSWCIRRQFERNMELTFAQGQLRL